MTAELRSLILSDRLVPGSLATVKTDGDRTARVLRCQPGVPESGTVYRDGPNGATFVPSPAAIRNRYGPASEAAVLFDWARELRGYLPGYRVMIGAGSIQIRRRS
jgi:hypothetical protein